jgi:bacterioferritin-associated ferredoxin
MYVCICNAITEKDIEKDPKLKERVGSVCGRCLDLTERAEALIVINKPDKH